MRNTLRVALATAMLSAAACSTGSANAPPPGKAATFAEVGSGKCPASIVARFELAPGDYWCGSGVAPFTGGATMSVNRKQAMATATEAVVASLRSQINSIAQAGGGSLAANEVADAGHKFLASFELAAKGSASMLHSRFEVAQDPGDKDKKVVYAMVLLDNGTFKGMIEKAAANAGPNLTPGQQRFVKHLYDESVDLLEKTKSP